MADADYEFGRLGNRVREILDEFQFNITSLAAADAAENKERDDKINDRKIASEKELQVERHDEDDEEETKASQLELITKSIKKSSRQQKKSWKKRGK